MQGMRRGARGGLGPPTAVKERKRLVMEWSSPTSDARLIRVEVVAGRPFTGAREWSSLTPMQSRSRLQSHPCRDCRRATFHGGQGIVLPDSQCNLVRDCNLIRVETVAGRPFTGVRAPPRSKQAGREGARRGVFAGTGGRWGRSGNPEPARRGAFWRTHRRKKTHCSGWRSWPPPPPPAPRRPARAEKSADGI